MARIFQTISPAPGSGSRCLDILSHLRIFVTSHQSSSRSFPAPLELPSRRCGCGGVSQRGKIMGSDGKSDANCWRVTSPAGPARLLKREEEDSSRPWVRQLLLTGRGSRWSASPPSGRQKGESQRQQKDGRVAKPSVATVRV